ncbi:MAG: glycosyltransferase [Candidatus Eisenbacteria bacterium]
MSAEIALVADALVSRGGAEKVFSVMCEAFPDADIFTSVYLPDRTLEEFGRYRIAELVDRRVFGSERALKRWFPLAALQMGSASFSRYRVVLSSSSHLARYVRKGSATHISYCYYPFRLLFEPERYPQVRGLERVLLRAALPALRRWDLQRAHEVDRFIAISEASRAAIKRHYGRDADVVFSPVLNVPDAFQPHTKEDFFLLVSRLEPWKMVDVVVEAFRLLDARLVIVGDGPERSALERRAGHNIEFVGAIPDSELVDYYRRARAVIHAANTEYGLTPIEANAHGTPAICWGVGGVWETMIPHSSDPRNATALFYPEPTPHSLAEAVRQFERLHFDPERCFANASRFGGKAFIEKITDYVRRYG